MQGRKKQFPLTSTKARNADRCSVGQLSLLDCTKTAAAVKVDANESSKTKKNVMAVLEKCFFKG